MMVGKQGCLGGAPAPSITPLDSSLRSHAHSADEEMEVLRLTWMDWHTAKARKAGPPVPREVLGSRKHTARVLEFIIGLNRLSCLHNPTALGPGG